MSPLPTWAGEGAGVKQRELAALSALLRPEPAVADMALLDWSGLLELARPALHPLLAHVLKRTAHWEAMPPDPRGVLERAAASAVIADGIRRSLVTGALARLEKAGIETIVLKGFALGLEAYPVPAVRMMQDVDFWIAAEELDRAAAVLRSAGFTPPERRARQGPAGGDADPASVRSLQHIAAPVLLDLHAAPASVASLGPQWRDRAWSRKRRITREDVPGWVMDTEDQLVHLALHAGRYHGFSGGLLPLIDLAFLLQPPRLPSDWDRQATDWSDLGVAAWIALPLAMARSLFGAQVPAQAAPDDLLERWGAAALEQMLAEEMLEVGTLREVMLASSWRERLRLSAWRFTGYYWSRGGETSTRQRLGGALSRLGYDLRVKLPGHIRRWMTGLGPRRQSGLLHRAAALGAELDAASTRSPP